MNKEKFIKQRMEIDKVTRKYFDKNYIVIECNCGKSYCNGWRCLTESDVNDVDLFNYIKKTENEKQQLISFLEDKIKEEYIGGCDILSQNSFKARKQAFQEVLNFVNKGGKKNE